MFDFGAGLAVNANVRSNIRLWSSEAGVLGIVWLDLVLEIRTKASCCPRNFCNNNNRRKSNQLCVVQISFDVVGDLFSDIFIFMLFL